MRNRLFSAALALLLSFSLAACGGGKDAAAPAGGSGADQTTSAAASSADQTTSAGESAAKGSGGWVDSDLIGAISPDAEIRPQDDFAAAVNGPWKLELGDTYFDTLQDVAEAVTAKKKQVLTDESIPGKTAACLRAYYRLATDWEGRNADGVAPLRPYIEDIEGISSTEELFGFFADPGRNPLFLSPATTMLECVMHSGLHKDRYAVYFTSPVLSLTSQGSNDFYFNLDSAEGFERLKQVREQASLLLGKLGCSEAEAAELIRRCMIWEKDVAAADNREAVTKFEDVTYERKEAFARAGDFPLEMILDGWGFGDADYIILNPGYAKKLSSLCSARNLENVKAWLIVNYCLRSFAFLDRDTWDAVRALGEPRGEIPPDFGLPAQKKEDALMLGTFVDRTPMVGALNRVYVENFFDESVTGELMSLTKDLMEVFEEIFAEETWLSDEGKAACIEKLRAIRIHIARQDFDSVDYGKLSFRSREDGGNFLEAYFAARRFEMDHIAWLAGQAYDPAYWDPLDQGFSTTITNAAYMPSTNGIYIFAGVCEPPVYAPDMSYEEKLAGLFTFVGHEITHGFDKSGAQYDKDGLKNAWMPVSDQKAFNDKNDDVAYYYSVLTPYESAGLYDGSLVNGEATADMGGLRATLKLAEKVPDFDYDRYFRAYARVWRANVPMEVEQDNLANDVHPLAFYRINVGVQQFDEFYETYDVKEGDGMYLSPEKRIRIW